MNEFRLSENYLNKYRGKQPQWGFGDLSYFTFKRTYALTKDDGTQEEYFDTVKRCVEGVFQIQMDHCNKFHLPWYGHKAQRSAQKMFEKIWQFKFTPPGRGFWKMGTEVVKKKGSAALFNCGYVSTNDIKRTIDSFAKPFTWSMDMLMLGVGVGFDTRGADTVLIEGPSDEEHIHVVEDSREGWVEALRLLLTSYIHPSLGTIRFDYNKVRKAGAPIRGFGGTASGPGPLQDGLESIRALLDASISKYLTSVGIVDIMNFIGKLVVSGNVRRSAEIAIGDALDKFFMQMKDPDLYGAELNDRRWCSNNSVYLSQDFPLHNIVKLVVKNGEPGLVVKHNIQHYGRLKDGFKEYGKAGFDHATGVNPCAEINLESFELCNICETYPANHDSAEEYLDTLKYAFLFCKSVTLLPTHSKETNAVMMRNRRIGVSQTGIQQAIQKFGHVRYFSDFCDKGYEVIKHWDESYSRWLGIPTSIKVTTVKPSGCRPKHALTSTSKGLLTLGELMEDHPENQEWHDVKGNRALGNDNQITKTYRNGRSKTIKITTRYNIELESTPNHRWFVTGHHDGHKLKKDPRWIRADELRIGDVIEACPGVYNTRESTKLDSAPVPATIVGGRGQQLTKQPSMLNTDICWMLGYLWGDGAMSPHKYRIRFIDANFDNLERCKQILIDTFGVNISQIRKMNDRKAYTLEFGNRHLWDWFMENGFYKYNEDLTLANIPKRVRESRQSDILAFIAGLVDADGCVSTRDKHNCLTIATAYDGFAKHLQDVALACGLILGRSLNSKGQNMQKEKHIWLMNLALGSDIPSCQTLVSLSNKMSQAQGQWIFDSKRANNYVLGKVTALEEGLEEVETFDIEVENEHWYYAGAFKSHNTVSLLSGSTPGVHCTHAPFYLRTVRVAANSPLIAALIRSNYRLEVSVLDIKKIAKMFNDSELADPQRSIDLSNLNYDDESVVVYNWMEDFNDVERAYLTEENVTLVVYFPVKEKNFTKSKFDITVWEQLLLVRELQTLWADNSVSVTITFDKETDGDNLEDAMSYYLPYIKTLSFLPLTNHRYLQAPYTEIDKDTYEECMSRLKPLELSSIVEKNIAGDKYCTNDTCSI